MDLITLTRKKGVQFEIGLRNHVITTDMSVAEGGDDGGPSPVELLGAAAGASLSLCIFSWFKSRPGKTKG